MEQFIIDLGLLVFNGIILFVILFIIVLVYAIYTKEKLKDILNDTTQEYILGFFAMVFLCGMYSSETIIAKILIGIGYLILGCLLFKTK